MNPGLRAALFLPPFGELADPRVLAELAARAEGRGWDGVFVWDHMLYREPVERIADPWVAMAAMACATERVMLGPMVTPIARRRPQKLARETVTLDHLCGGRFVLGVGLGGDPGRELTAFGEQTDARARARMLDEGLELLAALWTGEPVHHQGEFYRAENVRLRPPPLQQPRIPVWLAARWPNRAPLRRAARYEGLFPINLQGPDQLADMLGTVAEHRAAEEPGPFDVAVQGLPGDDPAPWREAGATWWLVRFAPWSVTVAEVEAVIDGSRPGS